MLSSTKEPKNIPISISILHEREYNNLCVMYKLLSKNTKRRAFSEKSCEKKNNKNIFNSPKITPDKSLNEPTFINLDIHIV
jgi:hypothetical protein